MKNIFDIPNIICRDKLVGHEGPVETVCIDEKIIVSGSRDKTIRIWDRNTKECIKKLYGHEDIVKGLAIDKKYLVSCSLDRTIRVWDRSDYSCKYVLRGHEAGVECVDLSKDLIASGSSDTTIKLWNVNTGELIRTLDGHSRIVSSVKIRKNLLYSGSWDHYINTWSIASGEVLSSFEAHFDAIDAIDVNADYIVSCDQSRLIRIWDRDTHELIDELNKHYRMVMDLEIKGNRLYSCSQDATILVWDLGTGILLKRLEGHEDAIMSIAIDGNTLVSASTDGIIRLWDDNSTQSEAELEKHIDIVLGLATNGTELVSAGTEQKIYVWDFEKRELIREIDVEAKGWIWGIALENEKVMVSGDDGIYRIYNVRTGELIRRLEKHDGTTYRPSLRNNIALTPSFDNLVKVWNVETGELIKNLKGHNFVPYTTAFVDDKRVASSGSDGYLKIWDIETGKCLKTFKDHTNEVFHISTDGDIVVTASADKTIRVYDVNKMECIRVLLGHDDQVWSIQVKNGIVFSGCFDSSIKIWDITRGVCLETIKAHDGAVKDLCLIDNYLVSGSKDGLIKIWDVSKYLPEQTDQRTITRISETNDIIVSLLQIGRAYEQTPRELGNPDITRMIYDLEPLDSNLPKDLPVIKVLKDLAGEWRTLGHLGVGVWYDEIVKLIKSKKIELDEDEVLESVIQEYSLGLSESAPMYWFGVLRYLGSNIKSILPNRWSYSIEFSGEGPTPVKGFNWTKLKFRDNKVELADREETALVFKMTLSNVNEWLMPLIKSIEIQVKDDRGDVEYMLFNNFLPDQNEVWSAISMFQINEGYRNEPNAIIELTDVIVNFNELLSPDFRELEILDEITDLKQVQSSLKDDLDNLRGIVVKILKSTCNEELDEKEKLSEVKKQKAKLYRRKISKSAKLSTLPNCQNSIEVFNYFKKTFRKPVIDTTKIKIKGNFSKFLEHIEPKFILFTAATSITGALISIMLYMSAFYPELNLLGQSFEVIGVSFSITQIIIYTLIYGILIILLLSSTYLWMSYFRKRKKLNI
ncbi:MAG: WD40 repeat domain-containing protein [Candidatus Lokiarchaeota archaeon]|nr:WD40 repeat domain-containing protein [Candidatus Lokiarchaeota archaeon]